MSWPALLRQLHRWAAVAFVLTVALIFALLAVTAPPQWLYFLPLAPLAVLAPTGAWMFLEPYFGRRER